MHDAVINRSFELILILDSSATAGRAFSESYFNRGEMDDIWRMRRSGDNESSHNAVFPKLLPMKIIQNWSKPTDIILDPFCGTGTTLMAAKSLGRKSIGIDISEKYCKISVIKCSQEIFL